MKQTFNPHTGMWEARKEFPSQADLRPYYGITGFNDAQAWINGAGNLTLGNAGFDDAAADGTHKYAKGDIFIDIPLTAVVSLPNAITFARTSAGIYTGALTTNTTQNVMVPIAVPFRKFTNIVGGAQNPKGFKITDLILGYTVATLGATSVAVAFFTEVQTNATARASTATPLGAVTYENPIGTVAATLPVATQATPYIVRAVPAAPVFVNADNTALWAEITVVMPNTSVVTLTKIGVHASAAWY